MKKNKLLLLLWTKNKMVKFNKYNKTNLRDITLDEAKEFWEELEK